MQTFIQEVRKAVEERALEIVTHPKLATLISDWTVENGPCHSVHPLLNERLQTAIAKEVKSILTGVRSQSEARELLKEAQKITHYKVDGNTFPDGSFQLFERPQWFPDGNPPLSSATSSPTLIHGALPSPEHHMMQLDSFAEVEGMIEITNSPEKSILFHSPLLSSPCPPNRQQPTPHDKETYRLQASPTQPRLHTFLHEASFTTQEASSPSQKIMTTDSAPGSKRKASTDADLETARRINPETVSQVRESRIRQVYIYAVLFR